LQSGRAAPASVAELLQAIGRRCRSECGRAPIPAAGEVGVWTQSDRAEALEGARIVGFAESEGGIRDAGVTRALEEQAGTCKIAIGQKLLTALKVALSISRASRDIERLPSRFDLGETLRFGGGGLTGLLLGAGAGFGFSPTLRFGGSGLTGLLLGAGAGFGVGPTLRFGGSGLAGLLLGAGFGVGPTLRFGGSGLTGFLLGAGAGFGFDPTLRFGGSGLTGLLLGAGFGVGPTLRFGGSGLTGLLLGAGAGFGIVTCACRFQAALAFGGQPLAQRGCLLVQPAAMLAGCRLELGAHGRGFGLEALAHFGGSAVGRLGRRLLAGFGVPTPRKPALVDERRRGVGTLRRCIACQSNEICAGKRDEKEEADGVPDHGREPFNLEMD